MIYVWIALGGALGTLARALCAEWAIRVLGDGFPWVGVLIINIVGSFVIGAFATLTGMGGRFLVAPDARQFVMVGLCGGFTTFSSFSLQTLNLLLDGYVLRAGANIVGSVVLCLLAVWLGYLAATALNPAASS
jgi:fluoride exporter